MGRSPIQILRMIVKGDASGASRALRGVSKDALHTERSTGRLGKMGAVLKAGLVVGIMAAVAAMATLVLMAKKCFSAFTDYMGEVAKVNRLTGMGVKESSRYVSVMKLLGVATDKGTTAVKFLAKNLYAVQHPTKSTIDYFKTLGVNIRDAHGKFFKLGPVLWKVRDAFAKLPDGTKKTALALKLFGRGGTDVLKFLSASPAKMRGYLAYIKRMGMEMGGASLKKFKDYTEAQHKMSFAWEALKVNIGGKLLPVFAKLVEWITVGVEKLVDLWHSLTGGGSAGKGVSGALDTVWRAIKPVVDAFRQQLGPTVRDFSKTIAVVVGYVRRHWGEFAPIFRGMLSVLKVVWAEVKLVLAQGIKIIGGLIRVGLALIRGDWGSAWKNLKGVVDAAWKLIVGTVKNTGKLLIAALKLVWAGVKAGALWAWRGITGAVTGAAGRLWDGIKQRFQSGWNTVAGFLNKAIAGLAWFMDKLGVHSLDDVRLPIYGGGGSTSSAGDAKHAGRTTQIGGGAGPPKRGDVGQIPPKASGDPDKSKGLLDVFGLGGLHWPKAPKVGAPFTGVPAFLLKMLKDAAAKMFKGILGAGSGTGAAVLAYARQFLGVPYLWGGTSPSGFDCSGFVQYVYKHFGINLPRVATDQSHAGRSVRPPYQLGDLLFFGSPAFSHHVGMYAGNGQMIDAPHTGANVRIEGFNWGDFWGARRVLAGRSRVGKGSVYDRGGYLPPGVSIAVNKTGRHERVVGPGEQTVIHNWVLLDGKLIAHEVRVIDQDEKVQKARSRGLPIPRFT